MCARARFHMLSLLSTSSSLLVGPPAHPVAESTGRLTPMPIAQASARKGRESQTRGEAIGLYDSGASLEDSTSTPEPVAIVASWYDTGTRLMAQEPKSKPEAEPGPVTILQSWWESVIRRTTTNIDVPREEPSPALDPVAAVTSWYDEGIRLTAEEPEPEPEPALMATVASYEDAGIRLVAEESEPEPEAGPEHEPVAVAKGQARTINSGLTPQEFKSMF